MKKLLFLCLLLAGRALPGAAQILYDDFETTPGGTRLVTYRLTTNGTLIQNQMNPAPNAVNMSPTVARYTRNAGQQYDNFDIETPRFMADVTPYINGTKRMSLKFYSAAPGTTVLLVLQNKAKNRATGAGFPAGRYLGEFSATTTTTNAWETLTFTFAPTAFDNTVTATTIDEITVLIAPNTFTGGTYHFDDVMGPELAAPAPPSTVTAQTYDDYEGGRRVRYVSVDGTLTPGTTNPAVGAANPSPVVARYVRNSALTYNTISMAPANATFLDDVTPYASATATVRPTMKIYSPAVGTVVQLVLANAAKRTAGGNAYPIGTHSLYTATTTVANAWQTLSFNYVPGTYDPNVRPTEIDRIDLQIAPNTSTGGTYFLDDIIGPTVTRPVARLYENFNDTRVLTYGFADGVLTQQAPNPSLTGLNPNPRVGRYVRNGAVQYDTFYATLPGPADNVSDFLNGTRQLRMLVYSPEPVGASVAISFLTDQATTTNYPTGRTAVFTASTTAQNAWQVLTFTYAFSPVGGSSVRSVTGLNIQFAGNSNTAGTWYFDQLYGPNFTVGQGALYEDFDGNSQVTFTTSNGATLNQAYANPSVFDENYSANVGHYLRAAVPFDALTIVPSGGRRLNNVAAYASTSPTRYFYLKVFSKNIGTPIQLVLQNAAKAATGYPNGNQSIFNTTTTKSNQWETLRFTYQPTVAGTVDPTVSVNQVNQLVLLFNPGDATAGQVYDFDFLLGPDLLLATGLTWTGSVSTDWNDGDNWSGGVAPVATPTAPARIEAGAPRYPILTAGNTYGAPDIIIDAGGSLTQTGGTMNLAAGVTNNGTYSQTGGLTNLVGGGSHVFGNGQPILFYDLTVGPGGMNLAGGPNGTVTVSHRLMLVGNVASNGKLIIPSNASGTGLVATKGGVVTGNVTVQRYIDPSLNGGPGYRHFAAPVDGATVADLRGPGGSAPVVNPAYNTASNPYAVTPFPTVYTYNEQRVVAAPSTSSTFDFGWQSPALTDALAAGRGYTVNLAPTTVTLTGPLRTGPQSVPLTRGATANSGWHLLGNPYPSPIDWDSLARPAGLDNALYTFRSNSQYGGSYVSYVNGVGPAGANLVAMGQGFFTRVNTGSPTFTFTDAARKKLYVNPVQYRGGADLRPRLELALTTATGERDVLYVYQESGATTAFDSQYDALKIELNGGQQPTLYQQAGTESFSIQGLPTGTQPVALALGMNAPAAGAYTFSLPTLSNFPASATVYLEDKQTGIWHDLRQSDYAVTLPQTFTDSRFVLHLYEASRALATSQAQAAALVLAYPNPAKAGTVVRLTNATASGEVLSATGRVVGRFDHGQVPTAGLAAGLYLLRNPATGQRTKLVVE